MDMKLNIKDGNLVTEQGNPLGQYRPVFAFGCDYEVTLSLAEPLPSDVTRLVAMLDTDFDFAEKSEVCALAEFSPDSMTFSMATRTRRFAEVISGRSSSVGYIQIDAIHEDGTTTRVLLDRVILQGVVADSSESYAVASVKGLEISANGTWVIDGVDTGQPARGEQGPPDIRTVQSTSDATLTMGPRESWRWTPAGDATLQLDGWSVTESACSEVMLTLETGCALVSEGAEIIGSVIDGAENHIVVQCFGGSFKAHVIEEVAS